MTIEFFENRRLQLSEQWNHWRHNWKNGIIRLVERLLIGFNVSDRLGGDLSQVLHIPEVVSQVKRREVLGTANPHFQFQVHPANTGEEFSITEAFSPQFLFELSEVNVDIRSGLVMLDSGFLIDSLLPHWQNLLYRGGMSHAAHRLSHSAPRKSGLWTVMPFSSYYFHTLLEHLPVVLKTRQYYPDVKVVSPKDNHKFVFGLLEAYEIHFEVSTKPVLKFENYVTVNSPRGFPSDSIQLLRQNVPQIPLDRKRRLFIRRSHDLDRSDPELESLVIQTIKDWNFESVNPSEHSIEEQIRLFRSAEIIIGFHGGGLSGMVWSDSSTKVIEIFNHEYRTYDFARIARACNHNYVCIDASSPLSKRSVEDAIRRECQHL